MTALDGRPENHLHTSEMVVFSVKFFECRIGNSRRFGPRQAAAVGLRRVSRKRQPLDGFGCSGVKPKPSTFI